MTNSNLKRAVRECMACTGENYTRARRVILAEREAARLAREQEPEDDGLATGTDSRARGRADMPAIRIDLPDTAIEDAMAIAEAIRSAGTLEYTNIEGGNTVNVTVGDVTVDT